MFGLSDNSDKNNQAAVPTDAASTNSIPSLDNNSPAPITNSGTTSAPVTPATSAPEVPPVTLPPTPSYNGDGASPAPVMPAPTPGMNDVSLNNAYIPTDPANTNTPSTASSSTSNDAKQPTAASLLDNGHEEDLIKLKQKALENLAPLIDHLDQTAEEKFKTTMMLIQASDNAELIQEAFDAASKITDEKVRAQALLDVVNEINYFTHHSVAPNEQAV